MNLPLWVNVVALLAAGAWIVAQILPPTRAVRLRNAFLAKRGEAVAFGWTPRTMPGEFRQETLKAYDSFRAVTAALHLEACASDWERALRIAAHLTAPARDLGPIQRDLETTYRKILQGYGYCADFVRVYLGLAHAAGLCARQWSFSFDGFGGHGHTFVEVFDRDTGKWCALDVHNNVHVCSTLTNMPLSALELREALRIGVPTFKIMPNGSGRLGFPIEAKLLAYWHRGLDEWYLNEGNAVFSYEARPLIRGASRVLGPLGQMVATLLGEHSAIRVLATPENTGRVAALMSLKRHFVLITVVFLVLAALLAVQVFAAGKVSQMAAG